MGTLRKKNHSHLIVWAKKFDVFIKKMCVFKINAI